VHHGEAASRKPAPDLSPLETADVVLTTYETLQRESPWPARERALLRMHWWRLVLDESQRVPKPANTKGSVMSIIAKACEELGRTHTWCMSGTPVANVIDDLLGQLLVLGVEPYCSRGDNGDAFWEREVRGPWSKKDPNGLEIVHDLLGQIMMRHSKEQTVGAAGGQRAKIISLPEKREEVSPPPPPPPHPPPPAPPPAPPPRPPRGRSSPDCA